MYYPTLMGLGISDISLNAVPSERLGLHGEYDHNGLAKRVRLKCMATFGSEAFSRLTIRQRGSVVVLCGCAPSRELLEQIVRLAMQVEGATSIELRGVEVCAGMS